MIRLTRFNGTEHFLNCELIETVEATPDTVISTVSGKKFIVRESVEEVIDRIVEYKRKINRISIDDGQHTVDNEHPQETDGSVDR